MRREYGSDRTEPFLQGLISSVLDSFLPSPSFLIRGVYIRTKGRKLCMYVGRGDQGR